VSEQIAFTKGHGTGNDFVILPDPHGRLDLSAESVRAICDRRFGIGADGILRVLPAGAAAAPAEWTRGADWFMDYRNSDGSLAQMCGNGARVFARHLVAAGLQQPGEFLIGTRGGPRRVLVPADGPVSVGMGPVEVRGDADARVHLRERHWAATAAYAPNPHAVAFVDDPADLGRIEESTTAPAASFPEGANIEFVVELEPGRVGMRVLERGSGETLSCGTGACAVAAVYRVRSGYDGDRVAVGVPGGELVVDFTDGEAVLTGAAELVATGEFVPSWWGRR
jgi:diaminopimelate epimerase